LWGEAEVFLLVTSCLSVSCAEQDEQPVKQVQSYWQHCTLATDPNACSQDRLPAKLDIWSLLAASLARSLPTSDEFDDSDAAVMAAVAFTIQVLKYPLEALRKGTSARERGAVIVSAEDLIRAMAWGNAWQALYQALTEVHHLRQKTIYALLLACMYEHISAVL
jgi:hypothetical protein